MLAQGFLQTRQTHHWKPLSLNHEIAHRTIHSRKYGIAAKLKYQIVKLGVRGGHADNILVSQCETHALHAGSQTRNASGVGGVRCELRSVAFQTISSLVNVARATSVGKAPERRSIFGRRYVSAASNAYRDEAHRLQHGHRFAQCRSTYAKLQRKFSLRGQPVSRLQAAAKDQLLEVVGHLPRRWFTRPVRRSGPDIGHPGHESSLPATDAARPPLFSSSCANSGFRTVLAALYVDETEKARQSKIGITGMTNLGGGSFRRFRGPLDHHRPF